MKRFALGSVVLLLAVAALGAQALPDPILGTWELNVAKSKFNGPAPKSETRTYIQSGTDINATSKTIDAQGKTSTATWILNDDGKDRPVTGDPHVDSLSVTRTDLYHAAASLKKNGKVVSTVTRVISQDGKTLTLTTKGMNPKGQPIDEVLVFEKR